MMGEMRSRGYFKVPIESTIVGLFVLTGIWMAEVLETLNWPPGRKETRRRIELWPDPSRG